MTGIRAAMVKRSVSLEGNDSDDKGHAVPSASHQVRANHFKQWIHWYERHLNIFCIYDANIRGFDELGGVGDIRSRERV